MRTFIVQTVFTHLEQKISLENMKMYAKVRTIAMQKFLKKIIKY